MGTKGNLGKLDIGECEDITGKPTQPRPRHRPRDSVHIWKKHVELALAMEELRKVGRTYEEAVATVAQEHHASDSTVKRAYGTYSLEPADPNSTEERRIWQKKGRIRRMLKTPPKTHSEKAIPEKPASPPKRKRGGK